jgi:hypothetical protein
MVLVESDPDSKQIFGQLLSVKIIIVVSDKYGLTIKILTFSVINEHYSKGCIVFLPNF